jgi:hypothetical protein
MRHYLLLLFSFTSVISFAQVTVNSITVTTPNPTSCSDTYISVSTTEFCANYGVLGTTVSIVGNTVVAQIDFTVGFICLPAIVSNTHIINLGQLPSGINAITVDAYLNGSFSSTLGPQNQMIVPCCGASASFTQSASEVCLGDSIFFSSTSTNADSVRWFSDGVFVDTVSNLGISFNSAGSVDISIVAYSDTCNDTSSASITVNELPQFSLGNDTAICSNDLLALSAPGFSSYLWSSGSVLNNSMIDSVGFIWLEVTDTNGCVSSDTLNVTSLIPLTEVNLGPDIDKCPESQETLSATASHASYLWSNGSTATSITAAQPGVYWLEATDIGLCPGRDTVLLADYQVDAIQFIEDSNKCGVNTMTLSSNYFVYNWSNGSTQSSADILVNSTVGVSVTDANGCFQEDSTEVEVFDVPNVDLGEDTYLCGTQGVTLTSNVSGQYLWSTGSQAAVVLVTQLGQYWLEVTNEDGCAGRDTIVVQQCVGVQEIDSEVKIYPNPANTVLNIEVLSNSIGQSCTIYNAQGIEVGKSNLTNQQNIVDVSQLANGIYFLEIGKDKLSTPIIISR